MTRFFLLFLVVFCGCQKKEESVKTGPVPEKVVQIEDDLALDKSEFVFVPNVPGMKIEGQRISKQGDLTVAEELKIIDNNGKVIDDFSLFDWGPIGFMTDNNALKVFPVKDVLEIDYQEDPAKKTGR